VCPDPLVAEDQSVTLTYDLDCRLRKVDGQRLRFAAMAWERLFSSASPPGAVTPSVARASLTRQALSRKAEAQKAARSGPKGLLRALQRAR